MNCIRSLFVSILLTAFAGASPVMASGLSVSTSAVPVGADTSARIIFVGGKIASLPVAQPSTRFFLDPGSTYVSRYGAFLNWLITFFALLALVAAAQGVRLQKVRKKLVTADAHVDTMKNRCSQTVSMSHEGFWQQDFATGEIMISQRLYEMLGYERSDLDLSAFSFEAHLHPEDATRYVDAMRAHHENQTPFDAEYRFRKSSGEYFWVRTRATAERDSAGDPLWIVGGVTDISAEISSREALQASENQTAALIKSATEAHFVTDDDGAILLANESFSAALGHSSVDAVLRAERHMLIAPHHRKKSDRYFKAAVGLSEGALNYECDFVHSDGSHINADVIIRRIVWDDRPVLLFTLGDRISVYLKTQVDRILHQRRKTELLGSFAAGVAHELNNLLIPIMTLTELTKRDLPHNEAVIKNMDIVLDCSMRASRHVGSVLSFDKPGAPEASDPALVDIRKIVADMEEFLQAIVPASIALTFISSDQVCSAVADDRQIHQAVLNLVVNAVQASADKSGNISIDIDAVDLDQERPSYNGPLQPGRYVRLTVTDSGVGIPEDQISSIFEPYYSARKDGTGLGLFLLREIIGDHNGGIDVTSEVGRGTRFDVYLPFVLIEDDGVGNEK